MSKSLDNFQIRCPIKGCYGWVNFVDNFYGCGHCGNVWFDKSHLLKDIRSIIKNYEYRKYSYDENNLFVHSNKEVKDYVLLVSNELA